MRRSIRFKLNEHGWNLVMGGVVGIAGALVSLGYAHLTDLLRLLVTGSTSESVALFSDFPRWERLVVPALGGVVAGLVLTIGLKKTKGKGPEYLEAIAIGDGRIAIRPGLVRSLSGMFSIASGESIGREGPMVQLSALWASLFARLSRLSPVRVRLIVGCGAAAGWTVAYNAPIGGALFVSEVLLHSIAMESFGPILASAIAADIVKFAVGNPEPIYNIVTFKMASPDELVLYLLLGILTGIGSGVYLKALDFGKSVFKFFHIPLVIKMGMGGLIVGLLAVHHPEIVGNGYGTIVLLLKERWIWQMVLVTMALKILATSAVFGSGAVGGVFTPTLAVGASLGFVFADLFAHVWSFSPLQGASYTMVGMGAFLAAVTQAPVMAIFIVFEMTYSPAILLPLTLSALTAYYTARVLGFPSIYRESLEQKGVPVVFDRPLHTLRVMDLMKPVKNVLGHETRLRDLVKRFLSHHYSMMHVVDRRGKYLGSILRRAVEDNLEYEGVLENIKACYIYHEGVPTVRPEDLATEAMKAFVEAASPEYDELPVVTKTSRRLVGVLSRSDLLLTISEMSKRYLR